MDYLAFLKYGALGISLALAILSFRLLSKEQDREEVRQPMLNSIKNYLYLAVFLSVFFGLSELANNFFSPQTETSDAGLEHLWNDHFNGFPDSTFQQKLERIGAHIQTDTPKTDTAEICATLLETLENCRAELEKCQSEVADYGTGFYQNVIKLKKALSADPDGWTNLEWAPEKKTAIFEALREIFQRLGYNYADLTDKQLIAKWKLLKSKWTTEDLGYIFQSDISQIVREFLNKYEKNGQ
ncbi:MAG: hypothetical protein D6714_20285 [Bacteroidetes bacterium]|nr:MAG: hypothetical protein D6714_20285 [Bacteroidota bacterium]